MAFRFRRSIKLLPGVRLNLSRSGVSTSVGLRGARITIGHGKVRETVGIPGTGVSYTETHSGASPRGTSPASASSDVGAGVALLATGGMLLVVAIAGSITYGVLVAVAIYFLAQLVKGFRAGLHDDEHDRPREG